MEWGPGQQAGARKAGMQAGCVASPCLPTSLTQTGPAVLAGLSPEQQGARMRRTPCTALCSTRMRAHPLGEAAQDWGDTRALGLKHASSGKRVLR